MDGCSICDEVAKWYRQPLRDDGSVFNWFLFVGVILLAIFIWSRVLARIV